MCKKRFKSWLNFRLTLMSLKLLNWIFLILISDSLIDFQNWISFLCRLIHATHSSSHHTHFKTIFLNKKKTMIFSLIKWNHSLQIIQNDSFSIAFLFLAKICLNSVCVFFIWRIKSNPEIHNQSIVECCLFKLCDWNNNLPALENSHTHRPIEYIYRQYP